jgi:hypothetical protein
MPVNMRDIVPLAELISCAINKNMINPETHKRGK